MTAPYGRGSERAERIGKAARGSGHCHLGPLYPDSRYARSW